MNFIEAAVAPLKNDAIARAEQEARKVIARVHQELETVGWDVSKLAPYPNAIRCGAREYHTQKGKYVLYRAFVKHTKSSRSPRDPEIVERSEERETRFVENAKEDAAVQYDAFVAKLVAKVGSVTEATLAGNHVWGYSVLHVMTEAGEAQNWKTQQVVNVSKLGKLFNQWPTRKVK